MAPILDPVNFFGGFQPYKSLWQACRRRFPQRHYEKSTSIASSKAKVTAIISQQQESVFCINSVFKKELLLNCSWCESHMSNDDIFKHIFWWLMAHRSGEEGGKWNVVTKAWLVSVFQTLYLQSCLMGSCPVRKCLNMQKPRQTHLWNPHIRIDFMQIIICIGWMKAYLCLCILGQMCIFGRMFGGSKYGQLGCPLKRSCKCSSHAVFLGQ